MAKQFEAFVASDDRFEIPAERHMGMVVFRLKGENEMTEKLLKKLNGSGRKLKYIHISSSCTKYPKLSRTINNSRACLIGKSLRMHYSSFQD